MTISMSRRQTEPVGPVSPNRKGIVGASSFFRGPPADLANSGGTLRNFLRRENGGSIEAGRESSKEQPSPSSSPAMVSRFKPISMDAPKMAWGTMMPQKGWEGLRSPAKQASSPELRPSSSQSTRASGNATPMYGSTFQSTNKSTGSLARPDSAPDGTQGCSLHKTRANRSTMAWRPNETSLARDSVNAIISGSKFDVPEAMMRQTSMGRQAEFGPDWIPPGINARKMTSLLTGAEVTGRT